MTAEGFPTVCGCGAVLPPKPDVGRANWGIWSCRQCGQGLCQDCGDYLDYNDECVGYIESLESTR